MSEQSASREECTAIAKVAEQAERYNEMMEACKKGVHLCKGANEELTAEERNLLSVAYKNVIGAKRTSYRVLCNCASKENDDVTGRVIADSRERVEGELKEVCQDVLDLLDGYLITKDFNVEEATREQIEAAVFYLKMKGDYHRYLAEVCTDAEKEAATESGCAAYTEASETSQGLPSTHPIKLGLALNFSVFYYEIKNDSKKACELAKAAFDQAIAELDHADSSKDSTLILQLLRDNLTLWKSEDENDSQQANE